MYHNWYIYKQSIPQLFLIYARCIPNVFTRMVNVCHGVMLLNNDCAGVNNLDLYMGPTSYTLVILVHGWCICRIHDVSIAYYTWCIYCDMYATLCRGKCRGNFQCPVRIKRDESLDFEEFGKWQVSPRKFENGVHFTIAKKRGSTTTIS